jgi:hypothetical protein
MSSDHSAALSAGVSVIVRSSSMGMNGKQSEHIYTSSHFHLAVFLQVRAPSQLDRLLGRQERTSWKRAERKPGWLLYCESVRSAFLRAPGLNIERQGQQRVGRSAITLVVGHG